MKIKLLKTQAILAIVVFMVSILLPFSHVSAAEVGVPDSSGNITVSSNTVVEDNYVAAAGQAKIDGDINGDLILTAGIVEINGNVEGNLILFAGQATVNGTVSGNVYSCCGQVDFAENSNVGGDVFSASGVVTTQGNIDGQLYAAAGVLNLNGSIGNGVQATVNNLNLESDAQITGDLDYVATQEMNVEDGAVVSGNISKTIVDYSTEEETASMIPFVIFSATVTLKIVAFIGLIISGVILLWLFPRFSSKVNDAMNEKFWPSFGVGLLVWIIIPIISITLMFLLIGFPLGLIIISFYALLIYLAKIFVGYCLGKCILKNDKYPIWAMVLGVFLISLVELIPLLGGLTSFVVMVVGLGSASLVIKELAKAKK